MNGYAPEKGSSQPCFCRVNGYAPEKMFKTCHIIHFYSSFEGETDKIEAILDLY